MACCAVTTTACGDDAVDYPPSRPVSGQHIGDPCAGGTDCADGLSCLVVFSEDGGDAPMKTRSCSADCSTTACPDGSVCVYAQETSFDVDGNVVEGGARVCAPSCTSSDECLRSTRAGRCGRSAGGGPNVCFPLGCWPGEAECPAGYDCVDVEVGDPSSPGWCQQR